MTIRDAVRQMEAQLPSPWPKCKSVPDALMARMCNDLWAEGINPRTNEIAGYLQRVNVTAIGPGLTAWRRTKGLPEVGMRSIRALPQNLQELARIIAPEIAQAPHTCFDPLNDGRWPAPAPKIIAYLGRIENQSLRNAMALFAVLKVNCKDYQTYTRISGFVCTMRAIVVEQGITDITAIDPNDLLFRIYRGEAGQALSECRRGTIISIWNDVRNAFEAYGENLSESQRGVMSRFFLQPVTDRRALARLKPWAAYDRLRQARTKANTDIVHAHFHEIRYTAAARLNQAHRVAQAVEEAIRRVEANRLSLPYDFTYDEAGLGHGGESVRQRVHLRLLDELCIFDEAAALGYTNSARQSSRHVVATKQEDGRSDYVTEYLRTESLEGGKIPIPLWFIDLYDHHVFSHTYHPEAIAARAALSRKYGYTTTGIWTAKSRMLSTAPSFHGRIVFLRRKTGRHFFPHDGVHTAAVFGNLLVRIQTFTGARLGEVQQIAQNPDCIKELINVGPKAATRWLLRLIPKGELDRADYFIDEETKNHLLRAVAFLREQNRSKKLPVVPSQYGKTPPDRYIFQWDAKALCQDILNVLLRFLLHGLIFTRADGKPVHLTSHMLRHAFATEAADQRVPVDVIARILHQRDTTVTKYYSRPTTQQVIEAAETMFVERIDVAAEALRDPKHIGRLLEEAQGKIGALTEVVGGTCVIGNLCPAKFACVGCTGNAPDPARRHEVQKKLTWATQQLEWAERQDLLAESRQLKALVRDCSLMLEEMDLIEAAKANAEQVVTIMPVKASQ